MHCPQCGQQQISGEVRFCSRCGFPLTGVADLIVNGGLPPVIPQPQGFRTESPKKRGVKQGVVLFMGVGIILTSILGIFNSYLGLHEFFPAMSAVIGFVGGFLRILYALIFEEGAQRMVYVPQPNYGHPIGPSFPPQPLQMNAPPRAAVLPSAPSTPASGWRPRDTGELVRPNSVTENTTRLLDREPPAE
jgi:hypothetical protein